jgi:hypothetical protein
MEQVWLVSELRWATEQRRRISDPLRVLSASTNAAIRIATFKYTAPVLKFDLKNIQVPTFKYTAPVLKFDLKNIQVPTFKYTAPVLKFDLKNIQVLSHLMVFSRYWSGISDNLKALADSWMPRLYEEATPDNLKQISMDDQLKLFKVSADLRIGIVRVIPTPLLISLLEVVRHHATKVLEFLLDHDLAIVSHIRMSSEELSQQFRDNGGRLSLLNRSCLAYEDGHYESAQALAVVVLDSHMCAVSKVKRLTRKGKAVSELRKRIGSVRSAEDLVGRLRFFEYGALACALSVFISTDNDDDLSRNSVVHGADSSQFTKINALKSITVASSVLFHDIEWRQELRTGTADRLAIEDRSRGSL